MMTHPDPVTDTEETAARALNRERGVGRELQGVRTQDQRESVIFRAVHIECQMSTGECGEMQGGEYALCTEC